MTTISSIYRHYYRAQMRNYAMAFRSHIHPNTLDAGSFGERCERAAHYIKIAMEYRNMASYWRG